MTPQEDTTLPAPPIMKHQKRQKRCLPDGFLDEHNRPRICELNAGVGVMSLTLAALGCTVAMLSECALHLHAYLKLKAPGALIADDNRNKPWIQWAAAGLKALILVAGVSCQPFSVAGKMLGGADPRAWDALLVCEAAVALGAVYVLLENVPGYVHRDSMHGVWTKVVAAFTAAGYDLIRVFEPKHSNCGGRTYRSRILCLFAKKEHLSGLLLDSLQELSFSSPAPSVPFNYELDRTRNWLCYGRLEQDRNSKLILQYTTKAIVPGVIVRFQRSGRLWRVQSRAGDLVKLMDTERRRSTVKFRSADLLSVQQGHKESRYPVQRQDEVVRTITAFGEPPARGGPLILVQHSDPDKPDEVFSVSVKDKALLNDFSANDLADMRSCGLTEEQITCLVGGCVPRTMVFQTLLLMLQSLRLLVPCLATAGAVPASTDQPEVALLTMPVASVQPIPVAPARLPPSGSLVLVAVIPELNRVVVDSSGALPSMQMCPDKYSEAAGIPTGKVLAAFKLAFSILPGEVLFLAGLCSLHNANCPVPDTSHRVYVAVKLSPQRQQGVTLASLSDLGNSWSYRPASLALAMVAAHCAGCTDPQTIRPMLDGSGIFSIGALNAKSLAPSSLHLGVKRRTRTEVLQYCRALETQVSTVLKSDAAALEDQDKGLAAYIHEWSGQTTVTDLKDVPDDLLDRLPAFNHSKLITEPFSFTARLDKTKAFKPPKQPETSFKPRCTSDLYNPLQNVEQRSRNAESDLVTFYEEMWKQFDSAADSDGRPKLVGSDRFPQLSDSIRRKQQLGKLRPEPLVMGLECWNPEALGTVWDIRGSKPVPVDFDKPLVRDFNLDAWLCHFSNIDDQQLVSHMKHGVCSGVQLDHLSMLAPPLLSLADGLESISSELARLVDSGYLRRHSKRPTWPWYTIPNGAVPKAGSDVWRRISDNGSPQSLLATIELLRVMSANAQIRSSLELPVELKPTYADAAKDVCIHRYIGDKLGWTLVQIMDDLKDWFYQLATHASEHWKSALVFAERGAKALDFYQETVMGMGYVHTSNVAQRLSITVLIRWYQIFQELDAPFIAEERTTNKLLDQYLTTRAAMPQNKDQRQDRLHSGHIFTDDFTAYILQPPHHSRVTTGLIAWKKTLDEFGIRPAAVRKRMVGASLPWIGILSIACLGIFSLQQRHVTRALAWIISAAAGLMNVEEYLKLVGLVNFACCALSLPASAMSIFWEPMRKGFEKDKGSPSTTLVKSTARRRTHWQIWSSRLVQAHGATVDQLFRDQKDGANVPAPIRSLRYFVWFTDAAIKGTHFPALGGYAHGLKWVFPLTDRMLELLPIPVLEFLALLAQVIIVGSLLPDPAHPATYEILVGTDSVTSAWKLQTQHGSSQVMSIVLDIFLARPEFQRLRRVIRLAHVYGEGNPLADNISRGDMKLFNHTCNLLGVKPKGLEVPVIFHQLIEHVCTEAELLADQPP